jgi:hypothetical protein
MLKWKYRDCEVEVTATATTFNSPAGSAFSPVVKIDCKTEETDRGIATSKIFPTSESAEQHGLELAHQWIDRHFANY